MPRRTVKVLEEQEDAKNSKSRLFAFGVKTIAKLAGSCVRTVQNDVRSGALKPESLRGIISYLEVKGRTRCQCCGQRIQAKEARP